MLKADFSQHLKLMNEILQDNLFTNYLYFPINADLDGAGSWLNQHNISESVSADLSLLDVESFLISSESKGEDSKF